MVSVSGERKQWIDIYKGIAILLMVVGHVTGDYNHYIYQFHMAAFFLISGYCTEWNQGTWGILCKRFYTLVLPFVTIFLFGVAMMWGLHITGLYGIFFPESLPYISVWPMIKEMVVNQNNYVWWMGAAWFVYILFYIVLVHSIFVFVFPKAYHAFFKPAYFVFVISLYVFGYYLLDLGVKTNFVRMALGQLYFGLGYLINRVPIKKVFTQSKSVLVLIACITIMIHLSGVSGATVDYPSLRFENLFVSSLSGINGCLFLVIVSNILDNLSRRIGNVFHIINRALKNIGKNTVAIMYFHFLSFKVAIALLATLGIVEWGYLQNFLPTQNDIGIKYLWLFLFVSILFSAGLWDVACSFQYGRRLMGKDKAFISERINCLSVNPMLINIAFFTCNIYERFTCSIRKLSSFEKGVISAIAAIYCMLSYNIVRQGIILNDEVRLYVNRVIGWENLLFRGIEIELGQGRPLRILAAINVAFSNPTSSIYFNRVIQVLLLGILIVAAWNLIRIVFKNKFTANIWALLFVSLLPISYEHGAPNAFNGLVLIPFIELILSLYFWTCYIQTKNQWYWLCSVLLLFVALLGYEFIITFIPVYFLLWVIFPENKYKKWMSSLRACLPFVIVGVGYVGLLFWLRAIFPVGYSGVAIDLSEPVAIIRTIFQILCGALPGFFVFNGKYQYLLDIYGGIGEGTILSAMIPVAVAGSVLIIIGLRKKDMECGGLNQLAVFDSKAKNSIIWMILYLVIPILPNGVTSLYQKSVSFTWFIWLPVSVFVFSTACLLLAYFVTLVAKRKENCALMTVGMIIVFLGIPIQYMNTVFSHRMNADYERIMTIEKMINTGVVSRLKGAKAYSRDLFETRNLLAIHDDFWNDLQKAHGSDLIITKNNEDIGNKDGDIWISFPLDQYMSITTGKETAIISKSMISNPVYFEEAINRPQMIKLGRCFVDCGFYVYGIRKFNDSWETLDDPSKLFSEYRPKAGNTKETIVKLNGIYNDWWCQKNCSYTITAGSSGVIYVKLYYPQYSVGDNHNFSIRVSDGEPHMFKLKGEITEVEISVTPNTEHTVSISTDFSIKQSNGDTRNLSWILSDTRAK